MIELKTRVERAIEDGRDVIRPRLLVDGRPLVDFDGHTLGVDVRQLRRSLHEDGELFIVTCACGDPGCAGIRQGIVVRRDARNVHWTVRGFGPTRTLSFERGAYFAAVEHGVAQVRQACERQNLDTVPANLRWLLDAPP